MIIISDTEDIESEKTATQVKAAIRTVFVVSAMSFHSIIEGDYTIKQQNNTNCRFSPTKSNHIIFTLRKDTKC